MELAIIVKLMKGEMVNTLYSQSIGTRLLVKTKCVILGSHYFFVGIFLSITSGILFTANNFIINQFQVVVSDAVLVRCVIQAIIFSCIIYWNDESFLPQRCSTRLLTLLQGM